MRAANCDVDVGTKDRCAWCGQFHLRPGYCQALEPDYDIDRNPCKKHVDVNKWRAELTKRHGAVNTAKKADRKAYMREYMRKRRSKRDGHA